MVSSLSWAFANDESRYTPRCWLHVIHVCGTASVYGESCLGLNRHCRLITLRKWKCRSSITAESPPTRYRTIQQNPIAARLVQLRTLILLSSTYTRGFWVDGYTKVEEYQCNDDWSFAAGRFAENLRTVLVHRYRDTDVKSVQKMPVNGGVSVNERM
jgi:hypothetical protein